MAIAFLAACSQPPERDAAAPGKGARPCEVPSDGPVAIEGGSFVMGQLDVYPEEEGPLREVEVGSFWIDPHEVTNRQFAEFVAATGYVTFAERPVDPALYGMPRERIPPELLAPGSAVFTPPPPGSDGARWWTYVPGASWRKPYGPEGRDRADNEPVVHLAYEDMEAYARWRGGRLPSEAEWEFAAKAGQGNATGQPAQANSWQGVFPVVNHGEDGFEGIAPVGCYAPNAFGLYDMIGNVWEMTSDHYAFGHDPAAPAPGEATALPLPRVIKGGSFLCAPNYCRRYRPAARSRHEPSLGTSNVGFRLVYDGPVTDRGAGD